MTKRRTTTKRTTPVKEVQDGYAIKYKTSSGYSLEITPLPPYYLDIVEDLYPFLEIPAREMELAAGDIVYDPYTPPEEKPDLDDEDYDLWMKWHDVDRRNKEIGKKRSRARRDLLMSVCIEIKSGPVSIDDDSWTNLLEAPFVDVGYKVPEDPGQRKLVFLKNIIIRGLEEAEKIMSTTMYREASMEGVGSALQGFQGNMGRDPSRESDISVKEEVTS